MNDIVGEGDGPRGKADIHGPRIVAFVGMSGVGKTDAVSAFAKLGDFHEVYFGGVVIREILARGLIVTEDNEAATRRDLRRIHGMAAMAVVSKVEIDEGLNSGKRVLIDGLYSYSELKFLRGEYGSDLCLVAIHARKSLRLKRLAQRKNRPLTFVEVEARDTREVEELEKAAPIALADYHIVNDGTPSALRKSVLRIHNSIFPNPVSSTVAIRSGRS